MEKNNKEKKFDEQLKKQVESVKKMFDSYNKSKEAVEEEKYKKVGRKNNE